MRQMVTSGEVDHLVPERVWAETQKALAESTPSAFLRALRDCGALAVLFPGNRCAVWRTATLPNSIPRSTAACTPRWYLTWPLQLAPGDAQIGFGALVHDLGKAKLTPKDVLPRHIGHEHRGPRANRGRMRAPQGACGLCRALAQLGCKLHLLAHTALELKPATVLGLFEQLDAFRRPERVPQFLLICEADKRGRLGLSELPYPQSAYLREAFAVAAKISAQPFVEQGLQGPAIGEAMRQARIEAIAAFASAERS